MSFHLSVPATSGPLLLLAYKTKTQDALFFQNTPYLLIKEMVAFFFH